MSLCKFLILGLFGLLVISCPALADTYCGSVSTEIQTFNPIITGSPQPVKLATYDLNTEGLMVQFANNRADYFVGVPATLIVGRPYLPWAAIQAYPTALVQDGSPCPILSQTGTPILTSGLTAAPIKVAPLCPLLVSAKDAQLVSISSPPLSIYEAVYHSTYRWLFVDFSDGTATMFVNVPASAVKGTIDWNSLSVYPEAIMAEPGSCPLLAQP